MCGHVFILQILKGEGDIVPFFLARTRCLLSRIERPSDHPFLSSVSAIHSIYTGYQAVAEGRQLELDGLFPCLDDTPIWADRAEEVCEVLAGVVGYAVIQTPDVTAQRDVSSLLESPLNGHRGPNHLGSHEANSGRRRTGDDANGNRVGSFRHKGRTARYRAIRVEVQTWRCR